jgi:hypothetical protein
MQFTVPIADIKFDASGDPEAKGRWTMRGHAAVFNRTSHDLGGFRTVIAPGAFTKILDTNPDVHLLWDHDTRYVFARTKNNSLSCARTRTACMCGPVRQDADRGRDRDADAGRVHRPDELRVQHRRGRVDPGQRREHHSHHPSASTVCSTSRSARRERSRRPTRSLSPA